MGCLKENSLEVVPDFHPCALAPACSSGTGPIESKLLKADRVHILSSEKKKAWYVDGKKNSHVFVLLEVKHSPRVKVPTHFRHRLI